MRKLSIPKGTLALLGILALLYLAPFDAWAEGPIRWQGASVPGPGPVNALALHPASPELIYAATQRGIYISQNAGDSWQGPGKDMPSRELFTLALDPRNPSVIYAAGEAGLYKSTDGGQAWRRIDPLPEVGFFTSLALDPQEPNVIYAGTNGQVLVSRDAGRTWIVSSEGLPQEALWALAISPLSRAIYAGAGREGLFLSLDGGVHWSKVGSGFPSTAHVQALAFHPGSPSRLYAATQEGLYQSEDGGASWREVPATKGTPAYSVAFATYSSPDTLYLASARGVQVSSDGGKSWAPLGQGLEGKMVLDLAAHPARPSRIYASTGQGLFRSDDGGASWQPKGQGLPSTQIYALASTPAGPLYAATRWGIRRTSDSGKSWREELEGLFVLSLAADGSGSIYAGTWSGEVYRRDERGWERLGRNLGGPVTALAIQADKWGRRLLAASDGAGLHWTGDGGRTWQPLNEGLANLQVKSLALAKDEASTLYAGTAQGLFRLPLADPAGRWEANPDPRLGGQIVALVAAPGRPRTLYALAAWEGPFKTSDGGKSWEALGRESLPRGALFQALALNPQNPQIIYAGTNLSLLRSDDEGRTWTETAEGSTLSLAVDAGQGLLYAALEGRGVLAGRDRGLGTLALVRIQAGKAARFAGAGPAALLALLGGARLWAWGRQARKRAAAKGGWSDWERAIRKLLLERHGVRPDMLAGVPARLRAEALQRYAQSHPEQDLLLREEPLSLALANPARTEDLMRELEEAQREKGAVLQAAIEGLMQELSSILNLTPISRRYHQDLQILVVSSPRMRLKLPARFPIIFIRRGSYTSQDLADLQKLMELLDMASYFALLVCLDEEPGAASLRGILGESIYDFIVLGEEELARLALAKNPVRELTSIILEQIDLAAVSPFVLAGPVAASMFFGREQELKTICRSLERTSFAIVGGRKAGKTSLLHRIQELLREDQEFFPLYLDCQLATDYEGLFQALATMWGVSPAYRSPENFRHLVFDLKEQHKDQNLIVLLDEVDALLEYDGLNHNSLLRVLRSLSQEGYCQFVLSGERVLVAKLGEADSSLTNFCQALHLGRLRPREARRAIAEPLLELGLELEEAPALIDRILALSSGHPNLIQYTCQALLGRLGERGKRAITLEDLAAVEASPDFRDHLLQVTWEGTTPLERAIALSMLEKSPMRPSQMLVELAKAGIEISAQELGQALQGLLLYSILKKEGPAFSYALDSFPQAIKESQDVEALLQALAEEIRAGNG